MMWPLLLAIAAAGAYLVTLTHKGTVHLVAGKRYRFSWSVSPALDPTTLSGLADALALTGGTEVTSDSSDHTRTTGSYVMQNQTEKDLDLGTPFLAMPGLSLTFTSVQEV